MLPSMPLQVPTCAGPLEIHELGDPQGPPVVYIHGALVGPDIWHAAAARVPHARNLLIELPLGCHRLPMREDAALHPTAVADLVAEVLAALDLPPVVLVANDSGGAIAQFVAVRHRERLASLVLTNCDAFDVFPPRGFGYLALLPRVPRLNAAMTWLLKTFPVLGRLPLTWGSLSRDLPGDLLRGWVTRAHDPGRRRDVAKFFAGIEDGMLIDAADQLAALALPATLVWGEADPFFRVSLAQRLAAALGGAELRRVPRARCYVMLDAPDAVADAVGQAARAASLPRSA